MNDIDTIRRFARQQLASADVAITRAETRDEIDTALKRAAVLMEVARRDLADGRSIPQTEVA